MERLPRPEILELKGKLVIFVGAGSSPEKRDIYATAKELGVDPYRQALEAYPRPAGWSAGLAAL